MTLSEFYDAVGGDLDATLARLVSESLLRRLLVKFLDDQTMASLEEAVKNEDGSAAFRAVHTLKGLALNLGFGKLAASSSELTEVLRPCVLAGYEELLDKVRADYEVVVSAIKNL